MAKSTKKFEAIEQLKLYDQAVSLVNGLERLGITMPYTASNTHMFSILTKDGRLGIRLPKNIRDEFNQMKAVTVFKNYGATMKDYVEIPRDMLKNSEAVASLLKQSWDYVNGLAPRKETKK